MKELPENIKEIIIKHFQGEAGAEDRQLLEEWLRLHPEDVHEFSQMSDIWRKSGIVLKEPDFNTANAWAALDRRLTNTNKPSVKPGPVSGFTKVMMAAILVGILFAGWWVKNERDQPLETITATTANRYLTLPDGTAVWLHKGATIKFPRAFKDKERKILLSGKAFFDVKPAVNNPFRIQTSRAIVEVLGTSFLVNATDRSDTVAVITGKVLFADKRDPEKRCILSARQQAVFTGKAYDRKTTTDSGYQFWQRDTLRFSRAPLKQVVSDLTAYYRTPVIMEDTLALRSDEITVTASFIEQSLEQVLHEITIFTGLHYRRQQDTIILY